MSNFNIYANVVEKTRKYSRKFRMATNNITVHIYYDIIGDVVDLTQVISQISMKIDEIFQLISEEIVEDNRIHVLVRNDNLNDVIFLPFMEKENFSTDLIMNEIIKVSQSNREFILNGLLEIKVVSVNIPNIGGNDDDDAPGITFVNFKKWLKNQTK